MFFKQIINLIINKQHLTQSGLQEIENIKSSMNFGPSKSISSNLIDVPLTKAIEENKDKLILNYSWVSGFVAGEGCFFINIYKKKESTTGFGVKLVFKITQDKRNNKILNNFAQLFDCGNVYSQSPTSNVRDFIVTKFSDNYEKIIPFFIQYKILGVKLKDFNDWCIAAELINNKAHLTSESSEKILKIKDRMNKGRILDGVVDL